MSPVASKNVMAHIMWKNVYVTYKRTLKIKLEVMLVTDFQLVSF